MHGPLNVKLGCSCSGDKGMDPDVRRADGSGIFMFAILSFIFLSDSHIDDLITTAILMI
jgi:hypothetical protein